MKKNELVQVIHAHWIPFSEDKFDVRMVCSKCKETSMPVMKNRYCPNCGARMDEVFEESFKQEI